jgi:hypothetical protein
VNPEPFTVSVNPAPPACVEEGLRLVMVTFAVAAVMVKDTPLDDAPLELTVTVAMPCVAIRLAETVALSWALFPNVVGSGAPFHRTVEFEANPEPFTVRVNACPPACAADGLMLLMNGPALADEMLNVTPLDVTLFALTATVAVPCVAIRLAATLAVN